MNAFQAVGEIASQGRTLSKAKNSKYKNLLTILAVLIIIFAIIGLFVNYRNKKNDNR